VKIRNWNEDHQQRLTPGQRAADLLRNAMGSWRFIGGFIAVMIIWAVVNTLLLTTGAFDPYPYILLNLFLSMLAGLQGAILLIAAKRQDSINATMAQHDYDTNVAARAEIERLLEMGEQHRLMLVELRALIAAGPGPAAQDRPALGSG
jgi:uncharacterized membrane protein